MPPPNEHWSVGAGVGHSESDLSGTDFSGRSLRFSTDVSFGGFSAGVFASQWEDSNQLDSRSLQGEIRWTADSGLSFAAIADDRQLAVRYEVRAPLNPARPARVDFAGTGYGADLGYFGEQWNAGVRFLDYSHGPALARSSLQGEWLLRRDALTQTDIDSISLRHGFRFTPHVMLETTLGFSEGGDFDSIGFGGLALTLRR